MQPMHPQYFQGQAASPYPTFPSSQYPPLIPPQGAGLGLANQPMSNAQPNSAAKQGAAGQKRKQVKNACVNCQKACKKCDEGRPCQRCIKYGLTDTCQDSTRKERKKGIKRGPYKRRQQTSQSGSASASPSNVPLGNPMGTPQSSYSPMSGSPNMRPPMSFAYTPQTMNQFNPAYDTLNHPYGYGPSYPKDPLMQQPYMVQPTIFPAGSQVLSYPMVAPQQQEILSRSVSPSPPLTNTFAPTRISSPMPHHSQTHTPASTNSPSNAASPNPNDNEEEEGSKLAILSQLCSTVLDNNDPPSKSEDSEHHSTSGSSEQRGAQSQNPHEHPQLSSLKKRHVGLSSQTPPPSPHNGHSRTPSYDHDHAQSHQSQVYHSSPHSQHSHYTMNGHLSAPQRQGIPMIYGTPNSSPSSSPTDASFSIAIAHSPKHSHIPVSQSSQPSWPLPSLQSVVSEHHPYANNHYQPNGSSQPQNGQNEWGIHVGGGW